MTKIIDNVSSRVLQFIEYLGVSKRKFEASIGVSNGVINPKSSFGFGVEIASKILEVYPQLNPVWLLTGKGEMIISSKEDENKGVDNSRHSVPDDYPVLATFTVEDGFVDYVVESSEAPVFQERQIQPVVVTVDSHNRENIVLVSQKAAAGYARHFDEPEYYQNLPVFSLPTSKFRNETFRAFEVIGDSMETTLYAGDLVISSYVDNWKDNIKEGYIYVVVTHDSVLVKRVLNRLNQRGKIVIQSDNEAYSTKEIDAADVLELWYVKAHIGFHMPNTKFSAQNRIGRIEADLIDLEARVDAKLRQIEERMKVIQ